MKKTGIIVAIGAGAAALLFALMGTASASEGGEGTEEEDPAEEPAVDPASPKIPTVPRPNRVPAMGQSPYNTVLFPSEGAVRGVLAGLGHRYLPGATGSQAAYKAEIGKFQGDWNFLAAAELLRPNKLNASRLKVDRVPGFQTLRGLEWARELKWQQKLTEAGL